MFRAKWEDGRMERKAVCRARIPKLQPEIRLPKLQMGEKRWLFKGRGN